MKMITHLDLTVGLVNGALRTVKGIVYWSRFQLQTIIVHIDDYHGQFLTERFFSYRTLFLFLTFERRKCLILTNSVEFNSCIYLHLIQIPGLHFLKNCCGYGSKGVVAWSKLYCL